MKLVILASFLMLLGLAGVMVTTILRVKEHYTDEQVDYGVILDAGSTSTKAYIYEWHHKISEVLPPVTVSLEDNKPLTYKVQPGIASIAPNYTNVGSYLGPIIEWARDKIPKKMRRYTPIFFRGTGGLRQLSDVQANALLYGVRTSLAESSFYFDSPQASILSLTEEAGYGFVSVNALYDKFQRIDTAAPPKLYGSLDMGGVSSDIAFVSSGALPPNLTFTINVVQSPCIPFGYYENVTIIIGGSPRSFLLMGTSNADECKQLVQNLVRSMTANLPPVPSLDDITFVLADHCIYPSFKSEVVLTKIDLTVKDFFKLKDHANLLELDAKASSFCQLSYGDALSHSKKSYAYVVQNYCFMGTYINALLTQYYGLSSTLRHLIWRETIQAAPVTWSLGAMLEHVSEIPPDTTPQTHERLVRFFHTDGGVVILFISVLVFILGLVVFIVQRQRRTNDYTVIQ